MEIIWWTKNIWIDIKWSWSRIQKRSNRHLTEQIKSKGYFWHPLTFPTHKQLWLLMIIMWLLVIIIWRTITTMIGKKCPNKWSKDLAGSCLQDSSSHSICFFQSINQWPWTLLSLTKYFNEKHSVKVLHL